MNDKKKKARVLDIDKLPEITVSADQCDWSVVIYDPETGSKIAASGVFAAGEEMSDETVDVEIGPVKKS